MYDVIIIGAGVISAFIAMELSKYDLRVLVLEKERDLVNGVTKGNSGIVHSGYSPKPGSLKARLNLQASRDFQQICRDLDIPYKKTGSILVSLDKNGENSIYEKYKRGLENKVEGLKILSRQELLKLEPNLSSKVTLGLYSENTAVVDNFLLNIRPFELAVKNGLDLFLDEEVIGLEKDQYFKVRTTKGSYKSKVLINGAGLFSDDIDQLLGRRLYRIKPKKGQYYILDKNTKIKVDHVIFLAKNKEEKDLKGMIIAPTSSGNIIVGPSTHSTQGKEDYKTSIEGLEKISRLAKYLVPDIDFRDNIKTFGALRPKFEVSDGIEDFIIEEDSRLENYFRLGGIKSPGLTCAPAIGLMVKNMVLPKLGDPCLKKDYYEKIEKKDPKGRVICRCENITEGEIVQAIRGPLGARDLDGLKKRLRTSMGTCQGGFCTSKLLEILERVLKEDIDNII